MRNDSLVHVHRSFGLAGCAAGEMKQSQILGIGRRNLEMAVRLGHQLLKVAGFRNRANLVRAADQKHVLKSGQLGSQLSHLSFVKRGCGNEHAAVTNSDPLLNRLRAEGREERAEYVPVLQTAQRADVKLGYASGERDRSFSLRGAQPSDYVGETIGELQQIRIGEIAHVTALTQPSQRQMVAARS